MTFDLLYTLGRHQDDVLGGAHLDTTFTQRPEQREAQEPGAPSG